MTERGETPLYGPKNKVGEGSGHKVKRGKGTGYARSSHHEGLAGPRDGGKGGGGDTPHTGFLATAEHKPHGSSHKLPGEDHIPFKKGIAAGDHFEAEIKEHFPNKKGVAGINKTGMPQSNETTPNESLDKSHGHESGKAEHHPHMKEAHSFKQPMFEHSHGYGHDREQKC